MIVPGLLVGEYPLPADAAWLREAHAVTAVVSLQEDADLSAKGVSLAQIDRAYRAHGIGFHRIPVLDGDPRHLAARLVDIVPLLVRLRDAEECVYLHCNAGFNRAPTAAIAYLHAHQGLTLEAARALVKERRHCVPYMRALELYFAG